MQDEQTFITGNMARIMAAKHAHALSLEWDRRRNEELQAKRQGLAAERSHLALHADVRAAEEAGLSYGKYMLLKNAGKQKSQPVQRTPTSLQGDSFEPLSPEV